MKKNDFALASMLAGIICFINLLGIEKAILSVVLGVLGIRELRKNPEAGGKWRSYAGIILGILYLASVIAVIIIKGPEIMSYFKGFASPR